MSFASTSNLKGRKITSMSEKTNFAIKCRIYPADEQCILFAKTFGCCRKVYNLMLADKIAYYKEHKKSLTVTPAKYKEE